jgi:hypothetical protein
MKRERIGTVTVDSGKVMILDPCYFDQRPLGLESYRAVCVIAGAGPARRPYGEITVATQGASAVVSATPPAARSLSVFAELDDDDQIIRIVIDLALESQKCDSPS